MKRILLFAILLISGTKVQGALKLASVFSSHMVLQRAPQRAVIWGTATVEGDKVTAQVIATGVNIAPVVTTVSHGVWKLKLQPVSSPGPFTINISSSEGHVTLTDVLFGDVWLCSGQSNMYFVMSQVMNATIEIQRALGFPNIRFTKVRTTASASPYDNAVFDIPWSGPSVTSLHGFSAVCWLFAEYLYPHLKYPIGLIEASVGGTVIEAWSSPEALHDCTSATKRANNNDPSALWNGMIHPLLSNTLFGVLWYQGEQNSGHSGQYSCQIQALLKRWRSSFNTQSLAETAADFPFGYVQLAPHNQGENYVGSYPPERWAQTAGYGYSPNPALPKTFMAVAMDLPDFASPQGGIHPRYKQDVAERLMVGALNIAYGHSDVVFQGPFPSKFQLDTAHHTLTIEYDSGRTPLEIRNNKGFEVCCSHSGGTQCGVHDLWMATPIVGHEGSHVTVSTSVCTTMKVIGLRYEWYTSPCPYKLCAIYSADSGLPAPPYITTSIPQ
ncbi:sialate O-acetylesterase-like [Pomacea canaliculata]|uniref:sialate O-acetylesterase-like n=1 Tax=Pomacea canaliculata TaxID=400727 RepID=UPI000D729C43|nr:sialate O-acetylesterase-like [Pomacea canaliculata]